MIQYMSTTFGFKSVEDKKRVSSDMNLQACVSEAIFFF